jgi:hypothetical protein
MPKTVDKAPPWGTRPVAVRVDGPRDGWWYFLEDVEAQQASDREITRVPVYVRTKDFRAHPDFDCVGVVWRYDIAANNELGRERGIRAGMEGRDAALAANPGARQRGMDILHRAALTHDQLSADTIRADLQADDVPGPLRGGLWTAAVAAGWIRKIDDQPSGGESAHGKTIAHYESLLHQERRTA